MYSPLLLWFISAAIVAGIWPVELPFKVFFLRDQTGALLVHADQPFPHKVVDHAAVEPHRHRRTGRPFVRVVVVHAGIVALVALLAGEPLELEQPEDAWVHFLDPEHHLNELAVVLPGQIIEHIAGHVQQLRH